MKLRIKLRSTALLAATVLLVPSASFAISPTVQPTLSISGETVSFTLPTYSGANGSVSLRACQTTRALQTTHSTFNGSDCKTLYSGDSFLIASDLSQATILVGMVRFPYNPIDHGRELVLVGAPVGAFQFQVWTSSVLYSGNGNPAPPPVSASSVEAPTPVKYSGPEFSGLSAKPVAVGASSVLEGKRLNEVSSITIGGKSATFTATATELKLDVPKDLAPGLYDLVINSSAGKLTQINAVRVQGPLTALSVTTVSEGRISSEQLHEHALIAAMQQPELTKARCIVNGPNLAQAKAQAERLCALVRASNKNIETTVVESRSTVKNNKVYARVSYGWN